MVMMMVIDGVSSQASEHLKELQNDSLLILPQYADQFFMDSVYASDGFLLVLQ